MLVEDLNATKILLVFTRHWWGGKGKYIFLLLFVQFRSDRVNKLFFVFVGIAFIIRPWCWVDHDVGLTTMFELTMILNWPWCWNWPWCFVCWNNFRYSPCIAFWIREKNTEARIFQKILLFITTKCGGRPGLMTNPKMSHENPLPRSAFQAETSWAPRTAGWPTITN